MTQHYLPNDKYEILTPNGWEDFKGIIYNEHVNKKSKIITFSDHTYIKATGEHRFFSNNIEIKCDDLNIGDILDSAAGPKTIIDMQNTVLTDTYDIFDAENHVIIANEIYSHQCDEFAFLPSNIATAFISSIMPTLSTGGRMIVTSTPNSDEDEFARIWKGANYKFDKFGNDTKVGINGFYPVQALWYEHPTRDETWKQEQIGQIGEQKFRVEHGCEFLIDEETLINSITLSELSGSDPVMKMGECRWYKRPNDRMLYMISLDPAIGTGGNNAAIQVFEMPSMIQVAEWCHNTTPIEGQIKMLKEICTYIYESCPRSNGHNIYWSVENNTVAEAALVVIRHIGEEKIPGLFVSEPVRKGHVRKFRKGFNTTTKSKITACTQLKHMIETEQMKINSKLLISELKNYVASGATFNAKAGASDDLVASSLLFIRIATTVSDWDQSVFDIMTGNNAAEMDYELPMPIMITSSFN